MRIQIVPVLMIIVYMVVLFSIGYLINKLTIKNGADYMLAGRIMGILEELICLFQTE